VRRVLELLGILGRLLGDRQHRVAEGVERLDRLGLGRLDHERLRDDQREVDRGRVEPVIHEPLGDVERAHAVLAPQRPRRQHELVHAQPVDREVVGILKPREDVVRVQDGHLGHVPERRPPHAHERVRAHEHAERPGEAAHLADRLRLVPVVAEAGVRPRDPRDRQERLEHAADGHGAAAGAAAAVRLRERLVQVEVDDVEAHVARP
jgi:hypothetical protein